MKRLEAELKGKGQVERDNREIYLEQIKLKAEEQRKTVMESIKTAGSVMGTGITAMLENPGKILMAVSQQFGSRPMESRTVSFADGWRYLTRAGHLLGARCHSNGRQISRLSSRQAFVDSRDVANNAAQRISFASENRPTCLLLQGRRFAQRCRTRSRAGIASTRDRHCHAVHQEELRSLPESTHAWTTGHR